ncbi:MAG: hypothetical protein H6679_02335 [Epsilonproteobacteria bacterium]|nr:hypothetical protein [Campylobacterota bacterium]
MLSEKNYSKIIHIIASFVPVKVIHESPSLQRRWNQMLNAALQEQSNEMMSFALRKGADPNLIPFEMLKSFIFKIHTHKEHSGAILTIFRAYEFNFPPQTWVDTILHILVTKPWYEMAIIWLMIYRANPHSSDALGQTALDKACNQSIKNILMSYNFSQQNVPYKSNKHAPPTTTTKNAILN